MSTSDSWQSSQALCAIEGGALAKFHTSQWLILEKFLMPSWSLFDNEFWLGGKANETGSVVWASTGRRVPGFLHARDASDDLCLTAHIKQFVWTLNSCSEKLRGICRLKPILSPFATATNCSPHVMGNNKKDSQTICSVGFVQIGFHCHDIDECELGTHDCLQHSVCKNTKGSYHCQCAKGYFGDGKVDCFKELRLGRNGSIQYYTSYRIAASCFEANERCQLAGGTIASYEFKEAMDMMEEEKSIHSAT